MELNKEKLFDIKFLIENFDKPIFEKNIELYKKNNIKPQLVCILTSDDPGSISYAKGIKNICKKYNVNSILEKCESKDELEEKINYYNNDNGTNGIIIMYPTPYNIKDTYFMNLISTEKDVEGLNHEYMGYLVQHEFYSDKESLRKLIIPPTAKGILYVLKRNYLVYENYYKSYGKYPDDLKENPFKLEGKKVVVINDSLAVGRSLALMMLNENASVRVCQKYTDYDDILKFVSISDIIISAVPSEKFRIPTKYISKNSIVFDIAFEGNFEYPDVFDKVYKISPKWNLVKKGNRINDMTLHRLISNLFYLVNRKLPNDDLIELKKLEKRVQEVGV
ncbi:bifunctional 5,10-methylenetetrahydrofolate dehydrogenase/5,10-methenyltetrahydrofolate cyclohydrolase [Marinitoga aeolica]|uniref:Bifunctional 5,10-methylenetetrahydrofolate dehydrogenase/5,10-methenyltetrahydrofolate cyclohydrolase n=1 Tax=Marinitoga aeolica TaxID=2809031 RepID=A0ABY8PN55_9BACT|nr:bifunctional 5,10-methylenetetrahydrofolate dehydrogenase/5,10-methenyltetrahydrofolate cyclohydrolase [Marinitoga aeolica]WGS64070.1 bifunctional 5,10-methylenetetrahydrofolate dehydrogenase/5,10-methenyltetrahydrofolate cyclohydrolase [Marinitoga aeolica]